MFIRWTGNGIFAPLIIAIGVFGVTNMTKSYYGPSYVASHPFVPWLGLALGGVLCWWIGNSLRNEEPRALIDEKTHERIVVQKSHTLYGVPMHWLGMLAVAGGLFLAFTGFPFPGVSRHVSESDRPPAEPVPSFAAEPPDKPVTNSAVEPPAVPAAESAAMPPVVPAAPLASPASTPAVSPAPSTPANLATNQAKLPPSAASSNSAGESPEQMAIRLYPALGVVGSNFNTRFLALQKRYMTERPAYFSDPDWPVKLAREVAQGVH
jgi:hypothetical protein